MVSEEQYRPWQRTGAAPLAGDRRRPRATCRRRPGHGRRRHAPPSGTKAGRRPVRRRADRRDRADGHRRGARRPGQLSGTAASAVVVGAGSAASPRPAPWPVPAGRSPSSKCRTGPPRADRRGAVAQRGARAPGARLGAGLAAIATPMPDGGVRRRTATGSCRRVPRRGSGGRWWCTGEDLHDALVAGLGDRVEIRIGTRGSARCATARGGPHWWSATAGTVSRRTWWWSPTASTASCAASSRPRPG